MNVIPTTWITALSAPYDIRGTIDEEAAEIVKNTIGDVQQMGNALNSRSVIGEEPPYFWEEFYSQLEYKPIARKIWHELFNQDELELMLEKIDALLPDERENYFKHITAKLDTFFIHVAQSIEDETIRKGDPSEVSKLGRLLIDREMKTVNSTERAPREDVVQDCKNLEGELLKIKHQSNAIARTWNTIGPPSKKIIDFRNMFMELVKTFPFFRIDINRTVKQLSEFNHNFFGTTIRTVKHFEKSTTIEIETNTNIIQMSTIRLDYNFINIITAILPDILNELSKQQEKIKKVGEENSRIRKEFEKAVKVPSFIGKL